jgi:hypothetical protein
MSSYCVSQTLHNHPTKHHGSPPSIRSLPPELFAHILLSILDYTKRNASPKLDTDFDLSRLSGRLEDKYFPLEQHPRTILNTLQQFQPTLASISSVCRGWRNYSTPLIYRNIVIESTASLDALLRTLLANEGLRDLVGAVLVISPASDNPKANAIIRDILKLCPRIKSEYIIIPDEVALRGAHLASRSEY